MTRIRGQRLAEPDILLLNHRVHADLPALAGRGWGIQWAPKKNPHRTQFRLCRSGRFSDKLANRLGQLAEASAWLNGRGVDMQLPVIYRLIEN